MAFIDLMITPLAIGITHSIETDHVVAVGNLVNVRGNWAKEAFRGATWGLGHTVSVCIAAAFLSSIQAVFGDPFQWPFEIFVGGMLVIIGVIRLHKLFQEQVSNHSVHGKSVFFQVGLVHGLAGSGSIAVLLSGHVATSHEQIAFLSSFGIGTILGMAMVATLFTKIPFLNPKNLSIFSGAIALVSIGYGFYILYSQFS